MFIANVVHRGVRQTQIQRGHLSTLVITLVSITGVLLACAVPATAQTLLAVRGSRTRTELSQQPSDGCAATPSKSTVKPHAAAYEPLSVGKVAELLRDGAIDYSELTTFDWILNLMGGNSDRKLDQIQTSINEANAQLHTIQLQLDALCGQLQDLARQLQTVSAWNNFQDASRTAQTDVSDMLNVIDKVSIIETRAVSGKPVVPLSSSDAQTLATLRSGLTTTQWLYRLRDAVGGKNGVIAAYTAVLNDRLLHPQQRADGTTPPAIVPPSISHLYTAAYMQPMQTLVEFYSRAMESGLQVLSDLFHADFTTSEGVHYAADSDSVTKYLGVGLSAIDSWTKQAAGGLASIPDNTMVDENTTPYTMWTQSPVSVTSDAKATNACVDAQVVCFNNDTADDGTVMSTSLVAPTHQPLSAQISANGYAGLNDWKVPTTAQYTTLLGEDGQTPADVPSWTGQHELGMFPVRTITSHANGSDSTAKIIGPLLAVQNGQPGALASTNPGHRTLNFRAGGGQNEEGGALVLTRSAVPETLCSAPWCPPSTPQRAKQTTATFRLGRNAATHPSAALNSPTTYTTPALCGNGPTYTVSPDANAVQVTVVGAAGGAGKLTKKFDAPGGRGGVVTTVIPVPAGAQLRVQVGSAGGDTVAGNDGGAGGATVPAPGTDARPGSHSGGGGGASGIASQTCSRWLAVAGGGGGGGSSFSSGGIVSSGTWHGGRGGDACPLPGLTSVPCANAQGGTDTYPSSKLGEPGGTPPKNAGGHNRDGTQLAGQAGTLMQGGRGSDGDRHGGDGGAGGGGGAGFYGGGGGGGGAIGAGGGGGGGGGSFAIPGSVASQTTYGLNAQSQGSVTVTSVQLTNNGRIRGQGAPPAIGRHRSGSETAPLAATGLPVHAQSLLLTGLLALITGSGITVLGCRRTRRRTAA